MVTRLTNEGYYIQDNHDNVVFASSWKVLLTFQPENWAACCKLNWILFFNNSLQMVGARSLLTLNRSIARICRFLMCTDTDLSILKFLKRCFITIYYIQTSFVQMVYFIIHCATMKHPYQWTVAEPWREEEVHQNVSKLM